MSKKNDKKEHETLTKGDAVGRSRMPSSSGENGIRGMTNVRNGINNRMMTGNPTAAGRVSATHQLAPRLGYSFHGDAPMVCVMAKVAPNATSCSATKSRMRDLRTRRSGSLNGVSVRSVRK